MLILTTGSGRRRQSSRARWQGAASFVLPIQVVNPLMKQDGPAMCLDMGTDSSVLQSLK